MDIPQSNPGTPGAQQSEQKANGPKQSAPLADVPGGPERVGAEVSRVATTIPESQVSPELEPLAHPDPAGPARDGSPAATKVDQSQRTRPGTSGDFSAFVESMAVIAVITLFAITFIVQAFQIPSESMENTLLVGDFLLVDKVHFAHGGIWGEVLPYEQIHRDDIVVFRYPVNPQQHFVKRVIGIPGDRIRMRDKQVFVNERPLQENYVVHRSAGNDLYRDDFPRSDFPNPNVESHWWRQIHSLVHNGELTVPPEQYFVLGDNRDESLDSRYWGFVPRENIVGRPLLIYWSMSRPQRLNRLADNASDKLVSFAYAVTHFFEETRWNRAFRPVR